MQPASAPPDAKRIRLLVATTRERAEPAANVFTAERAHALNFAEFTIAVPPGYRNGGPEPAFVVAGPQRNVVTVQQAAMTRSAFIDRLAPRQRAAGKQDVGVFVHGFNNNFQEALFRLAQIAADADAGGTPILFAWPSQARATGYVADRDSVTFSRDQLAELLTVLAANPRVGRITLVAHSMGAWLAIESLRQLRLAGKHAVVSRIWVVLAAPDIDVDVFRQQVAVIGPLSPPMVLLVSRDDRALSLASRLAGAHERVGALDVNDPRVQEAAERARIRIVDISELSATDRFNHNRFIQFAALYPRLAAADFRRFGAFVLNPLSATVGGFFTPVAHAHAGD